MSPEKSRAINIYLLMTGILFQGVSGIVGGAAMVVDPTGKLLNMPLDLLERSPFTDYAIPGIILLIVLGVFPLITLYALLRRLSWSLPAALAVGTALTIWIGVEVALIGYHSEPPLQLIYGLLGLAILALSILSTVRNRRKHSHMETA